MKQTYLYYMLFGVLALNMSWNFGFKPEPQGHIQLSSKDGSAEIQLDKNRGILAEIIGEDKRTIINPKGETTERRVQKLKVTDLEGGICECLIGQEIEITVDDNNKLMIAELEKQIEEMTEKHRQEQIEQDRKDAAELAKKEREKRKRQAETCAYEYEDEALECHQERITEVAAELRRRDLTEKERAQLEQAYENHLDAVRSYADDLLAVIYEAELTNDTDLKREARKAKTKLKRLERSSSSVVKRTVRALKQTEEEFQGRELQLATVQSLIQQAAITGNAYYGMQAKNLEDNLKYQLQTNPHQWLSNRADTNFRGGLSDYNIDYYMNRYDLLRKSLGLDAIYTSQYQSQFNINNRVPSMQMPNFRGEGFNPGTSSFSGYNSLDLSNLPAINGQQTILRQQQVMGPINPTLPRQSIGVRNF